MTYTLTSEQFGVLMLCIVLALCVAGWALSLGDDKPKAW